MSLDVLVLATLTRHRAAEDDGENLNASDGDGHPEERVHRLLHLVDEDGHAALVEQRARVRGALAHRLLVAARPRQQIGAIVGDILAPIGGGIGTAAMPLRLDVVEDGGEGGLVVGLVVLDDAFLYAIVHGLPNLSDDDDDDDQEVNKTKSTNA